MSRLADLVIEDAPGGVVVARVRGEVDASNATELRLAVVERLTNESSALVLDFSETSYLDSTGIALLFELARGLGARRQTMRLVVPSSAPIRRVVELCDVGSVAPLYEGADDALAAIGA